MPRLGNVLMGAASLLTLAGAQIPAPPAIVPGGIVNSASRMPATLAGAAIAPGARYMIPGVRLGPEVPVRGSESDPPVQLAGVSVRVAQGDRAVDARLLSVSAASIEAWMPDTAPLGSVQLTVTYQGRSSEPYKLTLAPASPGFYPASTAPASLPEAARQPEGALGDLVTLWGTGFKPGTVYLAVGGKPAADARVEPAQCCKGTEQIVFRIPAGAPQGCFVPVQARTADGRASNAVPIAVHPPGQGCHDELDWFREGVERSVRAGYLALVRVSFDLHLEPRDASQFQFDYGIASFGREESGKRPFPPLPPKGSCTLFTARLNVRRILGQARNAQYTSIPDPTPGNRRLDVGQAITLTGPAGALKLPQDPGRQEYYAATLGGLTPFAHGPAKPLYLNPGSFTASAPGGQDAGPFSVTLDVTAPVVWSNRDRINTVDRRAGVTLEWKAARGNDAILALAMNADRSTGDAGICVCLAAGADGHLHIPPLPLANFPVSPAGDELSPSLLLVAEMPVNPPARIEAPGLDSAFAAFISGSAKLVKYR
jgi:uncharacterized protein (TIGR03437 family)